MGESIQYLGSTSDAPTSIEEVQPLWIKLCYSKSEQNYDSIVVQKQIFQSGST